MKKRIITLSGMAFLFLISLSTVEAHFVNDLSVNKVLFSSPETVVQKQLNSYNERDIEGYLACFSDDVEVYMFPDQLMYKGKEKMRVAYANFFESTPDLYCELVERSVNGNKVKDEVLIYRNKKIKPMKSTILYQIEDGLIAKMYFI